MSAEEFNAELLKLFDAEFEGCEHIVLYGLVRKWLGNTQYANSLAKDAYDAGIKEGYACADIPRGKTYTETTFEQWLESRKTK